MAVDGRKFSDTLRFGSDEWIAYPCSPCAKDNNHNAATKHCVECGENLCKTCLTYHEKFTRGHQIVDKLISQTKQKKPELPVQRCDKHGGKLVEFYCPRHDAVGCSTCVAVDHSSCKRTESIHDVVKSLPIIKDFSQLDMQMKQLLDRIGEQRQQKKEQIKQLHKEKHAIMKEIKNLRKQINNNLDIMEKSLKDEVGSMFEEKLQYTYDYMATFNNMSSLVEQRQKALHDARKINNAELFVQMKTRDDNLSDIQRNLSTHSHESVLWIVKLFPGNLLSSPLEKKETVFGNISEIIDPKSVNLVGDFSVRLQSDKVSCYISDFCFTENDCIFCSDSVNKRIKKLDNNFVVKEHLDMPDIPVGICEVDNTRMAVTLLQQQKVQFVSQSPLTLLNSFSVGDCCRGIDCYDEELYVCCGGLKEQDEGPGQIEVYDLCGQQIQTIDEGLGWPCDVKATGRNEIFVSDNDSGMVLKVNIADNNCSTVQGSTLTYASGFCRIGDHQLCIAGWNPSKIVLISADGKRVQNLLTEIDGIVKPVAVGVCCNDKTCRLFVSSPFSDVIKIFDVIT